MSNIDTGGPAYLTVSVPGVTLRDWFAGQAMPAVHSTYFENASTLKEMCSQRGLSPSMVVATMSYVIADAMIAEKMRHEGRK